MALFEKKIIKNEIDYEKLAKHIVLAQEESIKKITNDLEERITNAIDNSLAKKQNEIDKGLATFSVLKLLAIMMLFIGFFISSAFTISLAFFLISGYFSIAIPAIIVLWAFDIGCLFVSILLGLSIIEIYNSNDTKLINTAFTAVMAIAALIIAAIQLYQGGVGNA